MKNNSSIMSSDEYHVQNIYRYSRKSYRNTPSIGSNDNVVTSPREDADSDIGDTSPRNDIRLDEIRLATAGCSCDLDPEIEIANILHKKCPVIALAEQQLQKLLNETDRLLSDNAKSYRSPYDVMCLCKETITNCNRFEYTLVVLLLIAFFFGLVLGMASCTSQNGKLNSLLFTCLDNLFISDSYPLDKTFRCIV